MYGDGIELAGKLEMTQYVDEAPEWMQALVEELTAEEDSDLIH